MKKLFYVILLLISSPVTGQEKDFEFRAEALSFEEGISHNMVYSIVQDNYGFMWFGTMYGLIRYDGINYIKYKHDPSDSLTLANDDIVCILESRNGDLWLGTYGGGLNKYNRSNNTFDRYDANYFGLSDAWDGVVWQLEEDDEGNIWIATRGAGAIKFNELKSEYKVYDFTFKLNDTISRNSVNGFYYDSNNREMWLTTSGGLLKEFDIETNSFITYRPIVSNANNSNTYFTKIISYTDSSLLIGSNVGIYMFDKNTKNFDKPDFIDEKELKNINIESLLLDSRNRLWAGTNSGLFVTDISNGVTKRFFNGAERNYKVEGNEIVSLCEDRNGLIWVGSYLGGIYKIHSETSPFELVESETAISAFELYDDNLLVGKSDGLQLYNYNTGNYEKLNLTDNKLSTSSITSIKKDNLGNYWIGTYHGIYLYTPSAKIIRKFVSNFSDSTTVSNNIATKFLVDSKGNVWIGTINGLNRYDYSTNRFKRYLPQTSTIAGVNVLSIYEDSFGYIWIGTYKGLNRFDYEDDSFKTYNLNSSSDKSISNNYVFSMLEDKSHNLWLATAGGLNYFNRENDTFSYFSEKQGFASSVLFGMQQDSSGFIWISSNRGLSRFDPVTSQVVNYDTRDGLQSNMFSNSSLKLPDGKIVFGGIKGFNIVNPAVIQSMSSEANIVFTSLTVMDSELADKKNINELSELKLAHNENFITIKFASTDFINPDKNKYKYILEGIDDNWKYSGNSSKANYTNLPPGEYLFKVTAANSAGIWSSKIKEISIVITPPFWETTWFSFAILLLSLSIVYVLYRRKVTAEIRRRVELEKIKIVENEKVRKKAADDFHDELGHHITKISLYSEILKRQSDQFSKEALTYLNKISELTKGLSMGVRDFIWTLDPEKDSLFEVAVRLKDFGDDLFDRTGISFTVEGISEDFENIKLSIDWRRHLTLMFKEAMNNSLKYAGCSSVSLSFSLTNKNIRLSLRDDGVGIIDRGSSEGRGLKSLAKRASNLNSKIEIINHDPSGTEIIFEGILS